MKISSEGSEAYFRINPSCPVFWGVTPGKMKMALIDFKAYFRFNPSCPVFWGSSKALAFTWSHH
jgi:hypothetical protein